MDAEVGTVGNRPRTVGSEDVLVFHYEDAWPDGGQGLEDPPVDAVEIDPQVHPAITANAGRNAVAKRVHVSAALAPGAAVYDLIVANIVAAVLIEHAPAVCRRLQATRGCLVLSGLLADELPAVADRYVAELGEIGRAHV